MGPTRNLIALTKTCLAPEAIDRPKDAQAVADRLTAYLDGVQERLHQAELAEAEAKAKAVEEAKRRRLTLALAGTVLLALTLGGGGCLWVKSERDARQAQVTHEVNDALNRATALREQAKAAPVGSAALFAQAREQAQRALALVENGPADEMLKTQVTRLQTELDEEDKDRKLLAALDEARLKQADLAENRFALERAVPLFREAFRAYGLPAGEGEPARLPNACGSDRRRSGKRSSPLWTSGTHSDSPSRTGSGCGRSWRRPSRRRGGRASSGRPARRTTRPSGRQLWRSWRRRTTWGRCPCGPRLVWPCSWYR